MIVSWILLVLSASLISSAVHPNRLSLKYPPPLRNSLQFLEDQRLPTEKTLDKEKNSLVPQKDFDRLNWAPIMSSLSKTEDEYLSELKKKAINSLDPLDLTMDEELFTNFKESAVKRMSRNHPQTMTNHFDVCVLSSELKDLGADFYPRYLQTANCRNQVHRHLRDRITCEPIHYHVQVLAKRKDTDPEDHQRNSLPEELRNWRFVRVPVNVGCHCTVTEQ